MIKAYLFDFDGTIGDTFYDLTSAANFIFKKYNKSSINFILGREIASDGIDAFLSLRFDRKEYHYKKLRLEFLEYYEKHVNDNFSFFDGILDLIDNLEKNNLLWGIVTNKSRNLTQKILINSNLLNRCPLLICGDDGFKPKPSPDMLIHALKILNLSCDEVIYVGDGYRDIEASKCAKIKSVIAAYGYLKSTDKFHDWGADYVINHPDELKVN